MKTIIAILTILAFAFGAYFYFEKTFAHAEDMMKAMEVIKKVGDRLEYKILEDQIRAIQDRLWKLSDRYDKKEMPESVKEEYRKLLEDKKFLEEKLRKLQDGKM